MDYSILEIHDLGLNLWHDNKLLSSSPGYALLEEQLLFGEQAKKQARIQPQNINNIFWAKLDTEPFEHSFGGVRHSADIAHEHLAQLTEEIGGGDVVIIVPSHYSKKQLSLLLGIIAESQFHAVGLIEGCLANTLPQLRGKNAAYIDIQLHNIDIAHLQLNENYWQCSDSINLPDFGWLGIQEKLCRVIADIFINQTRFDPLKDSNIEQQLYDQLPHYLDQLQSTAAINIEFAGHTARIEQKTLATSCQSFYKTISEAFPSQNLVFYCPSLLQLLPGFSLAFPQSITTDIANPLKTITSNEALIIKRRQNLSLIRRLPAHEQTITTSKTDRLPTHILSNHIAYPLLKNMSWLEITNGGTQIRATETRASIMAIKRVKGAVLFEGEKTSQATINGEPAELGSKLVRGDVIEWNGHKIGLITVKEHNAP